MRHRKSGRHLNRTSAHRKAMFTNMAASLIEHEVIKTTAVKAKELRRKVEPLITLAKEDTVANRRLAFSRLRSKVAVGKLFSELGPRYQSRPGGYTRILKAGYRAGDATMVAYVELVDRTRPDYDDDAEETKPATRVEPVAAIVDSTEPEETTKEDTEVAAQEVSAEEEATEQTQESTAEAAETEAAESTDSEAEDRSEASEEIQEEPTTGEDPTEQESQESKDESTKPSSKES